MRIVVALGGTVLLLEHLAEVRVFPTGGFQIENHVLDGEAEVVQALLQVVDGLLELLVTLLRLGRKVGELLALRLGQGRDFAHEFRQLRLEGRLVHLSLAPVPGVRQSAWEDAFTLTMGGPRATASRRGVSIQVLKLCKSMACEHNIRSRPDCQGWNGCRPPDAISQRGS